MKVLSGIMRVLSWIVYVVIIVAVLIALPIVFGNRPVVILSGSMEPAYPVGSIIYYKSAAFDEIQPGDAITFKIGSDSLATHRVVSVDEAAQTFVTKGDNNPTADAEPVDFDRVEGKASDFAIPYAGYFTQYMQNWQSIVVMGIILLLGLITGAIQEKREKAGEQWGAQEKDYKESTIAYATEGVAAAARKKTKADVSAEDFFKDL